MEEELISFNTAVLAKEKGFNEECIFSVDENNNYDIIGTLDGGIKSYITNEFHITAPTQSLLQKWLREEYNLHIEIKSTGIKVKNSICWRSFSWDIVYMDNLKYYKKQGVNIVSTSYELALEKALYQALKLIEI